MYGSFVQLQDPVQPANAWRVALSHPACTPHLSRTLRPSDTETLVPDLFCYPLTPHVYCTWSCRTQELSFPFMDLVLLFDNFDDDTLMARLLHFQFTLYTR